MPGNNAKVSHSNISPSDLDRAFIREDIVGVRTTPPENRGHDPYRKIAEDRGVSRETVSALNARITMALDETPGFIGLHRPAVLLQIAQEVLRHGAPWDDRVVRTLIDVCALDLRLPVEDVRRAAEVFVEFLRTGTNPTIQPAASFHGVSRTPSMELPDKDVRVIRNARLKAIVSGESSDPDLSRDALAERYHSTVAQIRAIEAWLTITPAKAYRSTGGARATSNSRPLIRSIQTAVYQADGRRVEGRIVERIAVSHRASRAGVAEACVQLLAKL